MIIVGFVIKMIRRNSYYIENGKKNMGEIKKQVDIMLEEDINLFPHDFVSTFNGESFPKTNHDVLEVPGEFKNLTTSRSHTGGGKHKYMDLLEEIEPDGTVVTKPSMGNIEYFTYSIDYDRLYDYDLSTVVKFQKRVFHVATVNYDPGVEEIITEVSGHPIKVHLRVFDEKRSWKVLNNLESKDYINEEMTEYDYMEFAHCIANATRPYDKSYLQNCVDFFTTIEKIDHNYRMNLHLSLKVMIKSAFKDDYEKTEELLTMITQALPYEIIKPISSYEDAVEQSKEFRAENSKLKVEISQMGDQISQQGDKISQQEDKISHLEDENKKQEELIKKLRDELNSKK